MYLLIVFLIIYYLYNTHYLRIDSYNLYNSPHSLKIVHLSDIHGKINFINGSLLKKLNSLELDYLVITGDLAKDADEQRLVRECLRGIKVKYKKLIVLGNYERIKERFSLKSISYATSNQIKQYYEDDNTVVLVNEPYIHKYNNKEILFWGFDNSIYGREKYDKEYDNNVYSYRILLAHSPKIIEFVKFNKIKGNLLLAGHTHGNQINVPIIKRFNNNYVNNHIGLKYLNNMQVHISRGVGTSKIKIRIMSKPHITVFNLQN